MPMPNMNQPTHWSYDIYLHLLDENNITLTEDEKELNDSFFRTLFFYKTLTFDGYLYSLNLFRRAITVRDPFTINGKPFSITELIYICVILGDKFTSEHTYPWNSDLCERLPPHHPYYCKIAHTQNLEQQFLKQISWNIEFDSKTSEEELFTLIQPLSESSRRHFMSEALTLKIVSANDGTLVDNMLKKHFPEFELLTEKALGLHAFVKETPLIHYIIDTQRIWMFIRNNIFLLMKEEDTTLTHEDFLVIVKCEVEHHFEHRRKNISSRERELLAHYFTEEQITLINRNNLVIRFRYLYDTVVSDDNEEKMNPVYEGIYDKLENKREKVDPSSFANVLTMLEDLHRENKYNELMFYTVFLKLKLSTTITQAYVFLHESGMLDIIHSNPLFAKKISNLLLTNADIILENKLYQRLESEFDKSYRQSPMTFTQLKEMQKKIPTDLFRKLVQFHLENVFDLLKQTFVNEVELDHTLLTLRDHLAENPKDGITMLSAIETLKQIGKDTLTVPLFQSVFQTREHMQSIAIVITTLKCDLTAQFAFSGSQPHSDLYIEICRAIQQNPEAQRALNGYLKLGKFKIPPYQTSPIIAELVRTTIINYVERRNILTFDGNVLMKVFIIKKERGFPSTPEKPFRISPSPTLFSPSVTTGSPHIAQVAKLTKSP